MAGRCDDSGAKCRLWLFTDGAWNDQYIDVRDSIEAVERLRYVKRYAPRLSGIDGAEVSFIGVGLGARLGDERLGEARRLANDLVVAAGAGVVFGNPVDPPGG